VNIKLISPTTSIHRLRSLSCPQDAFLSPDWLLARQTMRARPISAAQKISSQKYARKLLERKIDEKTTFFWNFVI
jgi:hypothetical protein